MSIDFSYYFSLFLRRIHYFLVFVAIGTAAGLTIASVLPEVYRSQAELMLESEQIQGVSIVAMEPTEQIQVIEQTVMTRQRLLELANQFNVYPRNTEGARLSADAKVADMRERISITRTGGGTDNRRGPVEAMIITIGFVSDEGPLSAAIANELADQFVQENREMRTSISRSAVQFSDDRAQALGRELSRIESEILSYQEQNINLLPQGADFRRDQQQTIQNNLQQLRRDVRTLTDQREVLVNIYERTGGAGPADPNVRLTPEEQQLREMEANQRGLLSTLAPTHPRLVQLNAQIEAMRGIVTAQQGAAGDEEDTPASSGDALYELRLSELDGQLELIEEQRVQLEAALEQITEDISMAPSVAVTLATMERNFENTQEQYNTAVARLAQAEDGQLVETSGRAGRLRIIENAVAPARPNSPNRPILAAAGVGGGFALGLAFIVLLELFNTAVRRPVEISNKLGITPLGVIPNIRTSGEQIRRRAVMLGGFALVLVLVPLALWLIHTQVIGLDVALNKLLLPLGLPLI